MYIKHEKIRIMKIAYIICTIFGIFNIASSVWVLISLVSHYRDKLETVLHAKATPECVVSIFLGSLLILMASKLKGMIEDANFFSSYFEGDLDGYVTYGDLADVTGKKESKVKKQMHLLKKTCMKNFELQEVERKEQIVLNSKKYICECKNCGAPIEKREYFTGACSYCGSSDLFAKVLADNRFYSISNKVAEGVQKPEFYAAGNLHRKRIWIIVFLAFGLFFVAIFVMYGIDSIGKYKDEEYLGELLLSGTTYLSIDLIKKDIIDGILLSIVFILAIIPAVISGGKRIIYIDVAEICAKFFAKCKMPFVEAKSLPGMKGVSKTEEADMLIKVRGALKRRYLLNCTLEKHGGILKVALAKQIVKDKCPNCASPIVGAVDENYQCKYCGNVIMDVVRKK